MSADVIMLVLPIKNSFEVGFFFILLKSTFFVFFYYMCTSRKRAVCNEAKRMSTYPLVIVMLAATFISEHN